jgi:hypothetical protein
MERLRLESLSREDPTFFKECLLCCGVEPTFAVEDVAETQFVDVTEMRRVFCHGFMMSLSTDGTHVLRVFLLHSILTSARYTVTPVTVYPATIPPF